jgi:hypothetical protein
VSTPAPPRDQDALQRLIVQIAAAINTRALYSEGHPRVAQAAAAVLEAMPPAVGRQDSITFLIVGEDLVADDRPLRRAGIYHQNFVHALRRRKVERLTLARGLELPELLTFVSALAAGGTPATTPHIIVGRVEMAISEDAATAGAESRAAPPLSATQINEGPRRSRASAPTAGGASTRWRRWSGASWRAWRGPPTT